MPIIDNVYTGLRYAQFDMTPAGAVDMELLIQQRIGDRAADSIVGITILPSVFMPDDTAGAVNVKKVYESFIVKGYFYDPLSDPDATVKYKPKNAKMFTYPFMYIDIDSLDDRTQYKLERFQKSLKDNWQSQWESAQDSLGSIPFAAVAGISPTPDIIVYPMVKYDNYSGERVPFIFKGFPQLPYTIDSYRAYIAENGGTFLAYLKPFLSTIAGSVTGAIAGNIPGAVVGGAAGAISGIQKLITGADRGDTARGAVNNSIAMIATRTKAVYFSQVAVNLEDAKKIDTFFSMYGYAVNQLKIPTWINRPHWNYVKTKQCNITGDIPDDAINKLKTIFNNGITWWKNISEFLNYTLDNSPPAPVNP